MKNNTAMGYRKYFDKSQVSDDANLNKVKLHLGGCVLLNPLVRMMQPKRTSRYPQPPPSLVIKPSASNSPSRVHTRVNRLTTSTSTPERMKVSPSLANQIYLGNSSTIELDRSGNCTKGPESGIGSSEKEEFLTVSIQPEPAPPPQVHTSRSLSGSVLSRNTILQSSGAFIPGPVTAGENPISIHATKQTISAASSNGTRGAPSAVQSESPKASNDAYLNTEPQRGVNPNITTSQKTDDRNQTRNPYLNSGAASRERPTVSPARGAKSNGWIPNGQAPAKVKSTPAGKPTPDGNTWGNNKPADKGKMVQNGKPDESGKSASSSKVCGSTSILKQSSVERRVASAPTESGGGGATETRRCKKSTLRRRFFENYPATLLFSYRPGKKKVSFALPSIERDVSDVSISSHLSAVSDCLVLDDDDL